MGTKFAHVYATLVIGYLEEILYEQINVKYGIQFTYEFVKNWKRFLGDCFILWTKSKQELLDFEKTVNSLHPDIRFTIECSDKQLPFLDVLVKKEGSKPETDIYYKPTDSKQYLLFNSCHPKHTRTSIPYSLARRIRSIVTNDEILRIRMNELRLALKQQNFPVNVIEKGIDKAMKLRKEELRNVREKTNDNIITYVSHFNLKNPELFNSIRDNLPVLKEDETMN